MDARDEKVNHPKHYNSHPAGIECIDVIEHMPFNVGSAMKYLWRAGLKSSEPLEQDMRKAIWYTEREIKRRSKMQAQPQVVIEFPSVELDPEADKRITKALKENKATLSFTLHPPVKKSRKRR